MGNENSTSTKTRGQPAKVPSIEPQHAPRKLGRPSAKVEVVDSEVYLEQYGKKPLYSDDIFTNFIQHGKYKIRSMPKTGGNPVPDVANVPTSNNSTKDDHKDHFSDFIQHTKEKLRTNQELERMDPLEEGKNVD